MVWTWLRSYPHSTLTSEATANISHKITMKCWDMLDVGGSTFILSLLFRS